MYVDRHITHGVLLMIMSFISLELTSLILDITISVSHLSWFLPTLYFSGLSFVVLFIINDHVFVGNMTNQ